MNKYRSYKAEDFAKDEYFQKWIYQPTPSITTFWVSFLNDYPEKRNEMEKANQLIKSFHFRSYELPDEKEMAFWEQIRRSNQKTSKRFPYLRYAAAIMILIVGTWVLFQNSSDSNIVYQTGYGETKRVVLPDESIVILNANSSITYVDNWDTQPIRKVRIDGQGYFDITHTKQNQPFHVSTNHGITVQVLGTTFMVYEREQESKIVLNTGKITLRLPEINGAAREDIEMKPGELVAIKENKLTKSKVNPEQYVSWKDNRILLDHTTLAEMIQLARENYGLRLEVTADSLLDQTVSGSMPTGDESLFIYNLSKVFQIQIEKQHKHYVVKPSN